MEIDQVSGAINISLNFDTHKRSPIALGKIMVAMSPVAETSMP